MKHLKLSGVLLFACLFALSGCQTDTSNPLADHEDVAADSDNQSADNTDDSSTGDNTDNIDNTTDNTDNTTDNTDNTADNTDNTTDNTDNTTDNTDNTTDNTDNGDSTSSESDNAENDTQQTTRLASLVSPLEKQRLTNPHITFVPSQNTLKMWLDVGTQANQNGDIFNDAITGETTVTIPLNGQPLFVTLWTFINNIWEKQSYRFDTSNDISTNPENEGSDNEEAIINLLNQAPLAMDTVLVMQANEIHNAQLNAIDVEKDTLTYEIVQPPQLGSISLQASSGEMVYQPLNSLQTGEDTFSYRVFDGEQYSNTANITVRFSQSAAKTIWGRSDGMGADLVLVAEGFTAAEMPKFEQAANEYVDFMFNYEPEFANHKKAWNIHRVNLISEQSGADNSDGSNRVNTALDAAFNCSNVDRLLCVDSAKTFNAVNPAFPQWDNILVIVNSSKYGGAGYSNGIGTVSLSDTAKFVGLHEMAHSFARLADEYTYGSSNPPRYEPSAANVTINNDRDTVKWQHWLGTGEDTSLIDLFEGGKYVSQGVWRPSKNSMMRNLGKPFHAVNKEAWTLALYKRAGNYQYKFPVNDQVSQHIQDNTVFKIETSFGQGAQSLQWYLNDIELTEFANLTEIKIGEQQQQDYSVHVIIRDQTDTIRKDANGYSTGQVRWQVNLIQ